MPLRQNSEDLDCTNSVKEFCSASWEETSCDVDNCPNHKKNGRPLEQGLANMEEDEQFPTAVPEELKRFILLYEASRCHGAIAVKVDS